MAISQTTLTLMHHPTKLSNAVLNIIQMFNSKPIMENNNNNSNNNGSNKNKSKNMNEVNRKNNEKHKLELSAASLSLALSPSAPSSPKTTITSNGEGIQHQSLLQKQQQEKHIVEQQQMRNKKNNMNNMKSENTLEVVTTEFNTMSKDSHSQAETSEASSSSCSMSASVSEAGGSSTAESVDIKIESEDPLENAAEVVTPPPHASSKLESDKVVSSKDLLLSKPRPILLSSINPHIICNLCDGYLIDATTIVECLHSFCHSCLIRHLRTEKYCPRCEMMINTAKPNIKPDTTLQAIVYKLVPGLYERELMRKRAFYKDRPEDAALATPEQRGDDTEHLIFSPSDYMSLSLEYADIDEHVGSNGDYSELLKPRYLQCPAMYTVAHLKKFVYGKFNIDVHRFNIDIMYKVKTIVLLDHYTLMDVAYIYTWKRDAPMRFYFRVKQSLRPVVVKQFKSLHSAPLPIVLETKKEKAPEKEEIMLPNCDAPMTIVHEATPSLSSVVETPLLNPTEIKIENDTDNMVSNDEASTFSPSDQLQKKQEKSVYPNKEYSIGKQEKISNESHKTKIFEIVTPSESKSSTESPKDNQAENLKITLISKQSKDKTISSPSLKSNKEKEKRETAQTLSISDQKDERKVENIKLKIDLSKQNSVTIINMSDPQRKGVVKPVKTADKEWKVKSKKEKEKDKDRDKSKEKEKEGSSKTLTSTESKNKIPSPLTVPPITIKAEWVSSLAKATAAPNVLTSQNNNKIMNSKSEDEKKSQFLKSFSLAPIKTVKLNVNNVATTSSSIATMSLPLATAATTPSSSGISKITTPTISTTSATAASKRKSKEPVKAISKKAKLSMSPPLNANDFKIKLPLSPNSSSTKNASKVSTPTSPPASHINTTKQQLADDKPLMPPPAPLSIMRPPIALPKKSHKAQNNHKSCSMTAPLVPHPTLAGIQLAAPGNRTPIAKRYQPILPKAARTNPFANIPSDVNKILKDAGTEIKSIASETNTTKVYGPKTDSTSLMGPPPVPTTKSQQQKHQKHSNISSQKMSSQNRLSNINNSSFKANSGTSSSGGNKTANNSNNYLNLAIFNASKSKGNEVPPGCRTPMYSPNSPIYSPSSPQYVPNYNIPTVPQYKYTPKPTAGNNSYLQSMLGSSSQMASLFPAPPTKKDVVSSATSNPKIDSKQPLKRVYPFVRSPSPVEDPPEKQLKVKSLLNSCNINIPSSLSITITREDSESQSNSAAYPKHKSPVNNYIEILKLPDQTTDNVEIKKQNSTSSTQKSSFKKDLVPTETPKLSSANQNYLGISSSITANNNINPKATGLTNGTNGKNTTAQSNAPTMLQSSTAQNQKSTQSQLMKSIPTTLQSPSPSNTVSTNSHESKSPAMRNGDKKTPSPEKRPLTAVSSSPVLTPKSETKSPKSPSTNNSSDISAGKKFRHILPRQNGPPLPEIVPPKVTSASIIGTYSSPSGVAVKIHANKKVPPPAKKSPGALSQQHHQLQQNAKTQAQANLNNYNNINNNTNNKSGNNNNNNNNHKTNNVAKTSVSPPSITTTTTKAINKILPHPVALAAAAAAIPCMPHHMQSTLAGLAANMPPPLGGGVAALNAAGQTEMSKYLKENLLRAQQMQQAAAAVASASASSPSNMFFSYANAAAAAQSMNPYTHTSPLYHNTYQQAYIMEQLSRYRAGSEAFTEYMQKLKNDRDKLTTTATTSSPKTSPQPQSQPALSSTSQSITNTTTTNLSSTNTNTTTTTSSTASKGGNTKSTKTI